MLFLSLIFCKQKEKLLFCGSVSGCTCLILSDIKGIFIVIQHKFVIKNLLTYELEGTQLYCKGESLFFFKSEGIISNTRVRS